MLAASDWCRYHHGLTEFTWGLHVPRPFLACNGAREAEETEFLYLLG